MIWALIAIAINRDIPGEPAYIRCARCGVISDAPTRTLSTMTWRPGQPPEHTTTPPEWTCPSRYTWNVPRDATTVTCPRCETRQPAAHITG